MVAAATGDMGEAIIDMRANFIVNLPKIITELPQGSPAIANPELANVVALFLSELIRSRRASLARAAEISSFVLSILSKIEREDQMLGLLSDMEKDFEEVSVLKQVLHFGYRETEIGVYETEIRQYAAELFKEDLVLSAAFLQDAARKNTTIQELCLKYPDFCKYLLTNSDKGSLITQLQMA